MIKAYGRLWKREFVDWSKKGLHGTFQYEPKNAKARKVDTNCWNQRGIYVLYQGYEPVYVGRVGTGETTNIGNRLNAHRTNKWEDKWDRFSWYGVCAINKTDGQVRDAPKTLADTPDKIISDLEAIAIFISDTKNKRAESLKADEIKQIEHSDIPPDQMSNRTLLEKILEHLEKSTIIQK